jgi:stage V sporulation protein S
MDRFFSKLDLRDIRIDPERTNFSPDEDDVAPDDREVIQADSQTEADSTHDRDRDLPADWDEPAEAVPTNPANREDSDVLKVSAKSRPSAVAGAIAGVVRESGRAEVQAIGAGATNQAVKAVAIARDYLHETGIDAVCLPSFIDITIENEARTAILLVVEPR